MRATARFLLLLLAARLAVAGEPDVPAASAQDEPRTQQQWSAITMFHGLPSPNVRAIAQDADGILWFGTDAGLVRYDGVRLERETLGTAPARVRALAVDDNQRLWVGTDAGAFLRRGPAFVAVPESAGHPVTAIAHGPDGAVALASEHGVLLSAAPGSGEEILVRTRGPQVIPLFRTADGAAVPLVAIARHGTALLVGTRGRGLLRIEGERTSELPDPNRPFFVTALIHDGAGRALLGAETSAGGRGLFALEGTKTRALDVPTGPVAALAVDGRGSLWVGTRDLGLFEVRDGRVAAHVTLETSGGALQSDHILAVFADRDGVLWIGTDRGVCRYDPGAPRVQRLGPTPRGNFIHALLASSDGRLWAGTQRGLYVREPDRRTWSAAPALGPLTTVYALAEMPDGRLLAGTPGGLYEAPAGGTVWTRVKARDGGGGGTGESVRAIRRFEGAAYLATYGRGLERIEGGERVLVWPAESDEMARREVVSLSVAGDALWIGTTGAGTFVLRGGRVTRDEALSALGTTWSVVAGAGGAHWIGSNRGLHRRSGDRLEPIVAGPEVRAVLVDEGAPGGIWCASTGSGLMRVAASADGTVTSHLATDYGLPSDSVYAIARVPGDGLALGTNRGLALYDPGRTPPGLRLRRVLGRRPYPPEEWGALHLEYPQNSLLVETTALGSRTYPEHFQYTFALEAANGRTLQRRTSHDGQFVAESLSPGAYCLEAWALDVDLRASAPVSLCFDVARAPMPWTSIALAALLAAALLALGWGYRQNRRLSAVNVALSETRLQLVQETENERRRIARDLHDQTLADLRRLLLQAPTHRDEVESISTEVRRICEDLSPSVLANVGLAPALEWALEESVRHLSPESPCQATFVCADGVADRLTLDPAAEIQIYRIVQEALSNVIRHARAREVRLSLTLANDGALEIAVEDDGHGFDARTVARGHGLDNMRTRASLVGAAVEWRPREGGGTVFLLRRTNPAQASS
jgi:signal transduction histidine kinase/ligand-binding sensor domain-containing protein